MSDRQRQLLLLARARQRKAQHVKEQVDQMPPPHPGHLGAFMSGLASQARQRATGIGQALLSPFEDIPAVARELQESKEAVRVREQGLEQLERFGPQITLPKIDIPFAGSFQPSFATSSAGRVVGDVGTILGMDLATGGVGKFLPGIRSAPVSLGLIPKGFKTSVPDALISGARAGFVGGAIEGATRPESTDQDINRLAQAAAGGAIGAPLGGVGQLAASKIGGLFSRPKDSKQFSDEELIAAAGKIPMTRAQSDPSPLVRSELQRFEEDALKGVHGPGAERLMAGLREQQSRGATEQLAQVAGAKKISSLEDEISPFARVSKDVRSISEKLREEFSGAFKEAGDGGTSSISTQFIADSFRKRFDKLLADPRGVGRSNIAELEQDFKDAAQIYRRLTDITKINIGKPAGPKILGPDGEPIKVLDETTVSRLENIRKQMVDAIEKHTDKGKMSPEARALTLFRNEYDSFLGDIVDSSIIKGADDVLDKFKKARALRAEFGKRFERSKVVKNIQEGNSTVETVTKDIIGAANFKSKSEAANIVKDLKIAVGEGGEQALLSDLKLGIISRVFNKSIDRDNGRVSARKLSSAIGDLVEGNVSLTKEVFKPEEWRKLKALRSKMEAISRKAPGAVNASNSAIVFRRLQDIPFLSAIISEFKASRGKRKARELLGGFAEELENSSRNKIISGFGTGFTTATEIPSLLEATQPTNNLLGGE